MTNPKKLFFPKRIAEPKAMGKIELDVFEKISKKNYKRWNLPFTDFIFKTTDIKNGKILDAGCGPGLLVKTIAKRSKRFQVTGLDVSEYAISQAKKNCQKLKNVDFKIGSVYKIPFSDNSFDIIVCKDSFHQFPRNPVKALEEMLRVVKKGGLIYINDLKRDVPSYLLNRVIPPDNTFKKLLYYSARAAYTKSEMKRIIRKARGKCIRINTRKITRNMARFYQQNNINVSALRESFQSRYVAVIKKV